MKSFTAFKKNILKSVLALFTVIVVAGCISEKNTDEKIRPDFTWMITGEEQVGGWKEVQFTNTTTSEHIDPSQITYIWTFGRPDGVGIPSCNQGDKDPKCYYHPGTYTVTLKGNGNFFVEHPTISKQIVIPEVSGEIDSFQEAPSEIAPSSDMEQSVQQDNATTTSEPAQ